eukprot:6077055-Alexandrium_andersonii.AAC.1
MRTRIHHRTCDIQRHACTHNSKHRLSCWRTHTGIHANADNDTMTSHMPRSIGSWPKLLLGGGVSEKLESELAGLVGLFVGGLLHEH